MAQLRSRTPPLQETRDKRAPGPAEGRCLSAHRYRKQKGGGGGALWCTEVSLSPSGGGPAATVFPLPFFLSFFLFFFPFFFVEGGGATNVIEYGALPALMIRSASCHQHTAHYCLNESPSDTQLSRRSAGCADDLPLADKLVIDRDDCTPSCDLLAVAADTGGW